MRLRLPASKEKEKAALQRIARKWRCSQAQVLSSAVRVLEYLDNRHLCALCDRDSVELHEVPKPEDLLDLLPDQSRIQKVLQKLRDKRKGSDT